MNFLTYKQASELLQCSYQAISVAVVEKRLTPVSTEKGPRLLEEQVRLFVEKRGISDRYLSIKERDIWETCKKQANEYNTSKKEERPVRELLESIDKNLSIVGSLEKLHEKINQSIYLQKAILSQIGADIPNELEANFPRLPFIQQNA